MIPFIDSLVFTTLILWFGFYLVNYSQILGCLRVKVGPWLLREWPKIAYSLQCPMCFAFWLLTALSLFVGFTLLLFTAPVTVMFTEMVFQKLRGEQK